MLTAVPAPDPGDIAGGDPVPIGSDHPGCAAMARSGCGQWDHCVGEPTHAAYLGDPAVRYFVCTGHSGHPRLRDVAPMTDVDRAELDGRWVQWLRAMAGLRFERFGPAPADDLSAP